MKENSRWREEKRNLYMNDKWVVMKECRQVKWHETCKEEAEEEDSGG